MTEIPEPAWLSAMVDQKMAELRAVIRVADIDAPFDIIMTTLAGPDEDATDEEVERWERTCDNCGTYCPDPEPFFTGNVTRSIKKIQVIIMFGVCPNCK